jgi:hypothetical protein
MYAPLKLIESYGLKEEILFFPDNPTTTMLVWWLRPVIPTIRRQRQEDLKIEDNLGYTEKPSRKSVLFLLKI